MRRTALDASLTSHDVLIDSCSGQLTVADTVAPGGTGVTVSIPPFLDAPPAASPGHRMYGRTDTTDGADASASGGDRR